jgi:Mrp family chromosome partitioning ATPase
MSRIADALRLANLETPGADAFTAQGHPWGRDLEAGGGATREWSTEGTREPAGVQATSPLANLPSGIRQQIAGVVERVFLPTSGEAPRTVVFAGVDADAQSGWIAAAVADMLAQRTPASVAVVDMNFASPQLHDYFGISPTPGLIEALGSDAPLVTSARQVRANLTVIPAGEPHAAAELTTGARARISRLATTYDHVIVSLEPLAASHGGGLPTMCDGVVLVIAADATRRQAGRAVADWLQASGTTILGAVLTNRRYAIPEAIYRRL